MKHTLSDRFTIEMNAAISGENWHGPEGPYRWSGPGARSTVRLPVLRDRELVVVVSYKAAYTTDQLRRLRVEIDGTPVPYALRKDLRPKCIVLRVPPRKASSNAPTELALVLPHTVAPNQVRNDSPDLRLLGLAVYSISVMPARPGLAKGFGVSRRESLRRVLGHAGEHRVAENFPATYFDGLAYLQANLDVAEAVAAGNVPSALEHYCSHGYKEHRSFALAISRTPNQGSAVDLTRLEASALKAEMRGELDGRTGRLGDQVGSRIEGLQRSFISDRDHLRGQISRLETGLAARSRADETREQELQTQRGEIARLDRELAARSRADEARQKQLQAQREEMARLDRELAARGRADEARQKELQVQRVEIARLDRELAARSRADEARQQDLRFQLDALRGASAEMQKELATTDDEVHRLQHQTQGMTTRFTSEIGAQSARLEASIAKIQATLSGFAFATELEAARVEVGKAVGGLEALRADLRRVEQFSRDGIEQVHAQISALVAKGEARQQESASQLDDVRADLRRVDEFSRDGMDQVHAQISALAASGEARRQELASQLDHVREQTAKTAETLAAASAGDMARLRQETLNGLERLQGELAASLAREQSLQRELETLSAAVAGLQQQLAEAAPARELEAVRTQIVAVSTAAQARDGTIQAEMLAGLGSIRASLAGLDDQVSKAARNEDLERLKRDALHDLERMRSQIGAAEARDGTIQAEIDSVRSSAAKSRADDLAREQALLERLESVRASLARLDEQVSKAARSDDLERLKRDALHDLERVRGELGAAIAVREVRDQATLQHVDGLKSALQEAQARLAGTARADDLDRVKREAGHDIDRVRGEIGALSALDKTRDQAFLAQIDALKAEVSSAKTRSELAEVKIAAAHRELGAETWQIAGTLSQLGNKLETAHTEVTKIQQELGTVKTNAARIVNPHLNTLNVLGYQAHSRLLARADAEKLATHWAPLLGLKVEEKELFYLAHRVGNIESACAGRLAASVNDILLRILVARAVKARSLDILEIGTLFGLGIGALHEALSPLFERVRFTVIDPLEGYYGAANKDILTGVPVNKAVFEENLRRTGVQSDKVRLIQKLSTDPQALKQASARRYDVVIIDADHSYAGVKNDTEKFVATAKPGAYLIFDDYGNQHWPDVKKYVDSEVLPRKDLKFVGAEWHTAVCQVSAAAA